MGSPSIIWGMSRYDAVCFDLDSTLCESTRSREQLLAATFDCVGVEPFCTPASLRAASTAIPSAETDREFFELLFAEAANRADLDPGIGPDLADAYLGVVDPGAVRFRPGAMEALESARDVGPVGLITNGSRGTQTQKLEALDLREFFDVAVFTDLENGVPPKPDSTPFETALSGLGVVPEGTIHVGDSLHADVGGANAMGMDSAWVDPGIDTLGVHEPTYELASLEEFPAVL